MTDQVQHPAYQRGADALVMGALVRAAASGATPQALITALDHAHPNWMQLMVASTGAASAGLPGDCALVALDLRGFDTREKADQIRRARYALRPAFSTLWGVPVHIREA